MATNLPTGTVTFLFTDIQGSTDLAQKFPDALPVLLARHNTILRGAIESHRGVVFRIAGDSFSAAFDVPGDALNAALDAQRELNAEDWQPAPIRVRMGINTGAAHAKELDNLGSAYEGYSTLARVARVMALAHGGQILLANSTSELVRDNLPREISLRDMGEHQLKGLIQRERLWQVVAPDLPQDFPPLPTFQAAPSNLPVRLNRLIGRTRELEQIKVRLGETRLLTLLGPGGTGKTSLALQAASELRGEFQDAVYFVDLAASRDTDAVLAAIARALGVREQRDASLLDAIKNHIKDSKILLLLDNFEQVTIAAPTIAELVRGCSELRALVTSREALRVRGEVVLPIPPLAVPLPELRKQSFEKIAQAEAVQLFVERARAVKPDFELTRENAYMVAEICARLDGLPLAIELATARLNVLTPHAIMERLDNRMKLLRGGARDLPTRQQTLSDTIEWSYEMLDADEQQLFALLSVFSGARFEAIEVIVGKLEHVQELDVLEVVGSLADKSLIRQTTEPDGSARFQMLETIREFAARRLAQNSELSSAAQRAHATYFADFTKQQWGPLTRDGRERALTSLATELENIHSAWKYWVAEKDLEQLGKFTDTLWALNDTRGWYHATVQMTTDLLHVLATGESSPEHARQEIVLQTSLARALMATKGYTEEVEQAYARALALCEQAGEIPQLFPVLRGLSSFYSLHFQSAQAAEIGRRILRLGEQLEDIDIQAEGHLVIGFNLTDSNHLHLGLEHLEQAIAMYNPKRQRVRRMGLGANPGVIALIVYALTSWMVGMPERARRCGGEAIQLAHSLEHPFSMCYALFHYALLQLWLGYPEITLARAQTLLDVAQEHEFEIWSAVGACLRGAALVYTGSPQEGLPILEHGMQVYRGLRTPPVFWPLLLQIHAAALGTASRPQEGLVLMDEANAISAQAEGDTFAPEFLGLKGDLELAHSPESAEQVQELYLQAVTIASTLRANMLELRAALRLSRLWRAQGKTQEAREVLQTAYAKMTEGFEMPDMIQARALLQELGE